MASKIYSEAFYPQEETVMKPRLVSFALVVIGLVAIITSPIQADPLTNEVIKFYQLPLNNGAVPIPPGAVAIGAPAPFPGHDELSTAYPIPPTQTNNYVGT